MINRKSFYETARLSLFGGTMRTSQVEGIEGILDVWEAEHASQDDRWLAYMLATAHHETDRTMRPIKEYGGPAWYKKMYDVTGMRPTLAKSMGNKAPGDGLKYFGRGYVQLTWKCNYEAMSKICGVDLVASPERALEVKIATKVMFHGMINGTFTGKKLGNYFAGKTQDWVNARRIINGTDKANVIAEHGRRYYTAICYTTG